MSKASRERERQRNEKFLKAKPGHFRNMPIEEMMYFGIKASFDEDFHKYMHLDFTQEHEDGHKIISDYFYPNDPAYFFKDNYGRPMTANKAMQNGTASDDFNSYGKILLSGYVAEVHHYNMDEKLEKLMKLQCFNTMFNIMFKWKNGATFSELHHASLTNDDGKYVYYYIRSKYEYNKEDYKNILNKLDGEMMDEILEHWMADVKWCYNYLYN